MIPEQTKINQQLRFQFVLTDSHSRLVGIFQKVEFLSKYQNENESNFNGTWLKNILKSVFVIKVIYLIYIYGTFL